MENIRAKKVRGHWPNGQQPRCSPQNAAKMPELLKMSSFVL